MSTLWKDLMMAKCCYNEMTRRNCESGNNKSPPPVIIKKRNKTIREMTVEERKAKREQWRINSRNYRLRQSMKRREQEAGSDVQETPNPGSPPPVEPEWVECGLPYGRFSEDTYLEEASDDENARHGL